MKPIDLAKLVNTTGEFRVGCMMTKHNGNIEYATPQVFNYISYIPCVFSGIVEYI